MHHYLYLFISLRLMGKSPLLELLIFSILRRRLARFEFLKMCFRGLALLISPNHLHSPSAPPELQIRLLSGEAHALLLLIGFQRVHHQTPEKDLAKRPSELSSIISEQAAAFLPIWSIGPPPRLRRRRLENCKTLIAMGSPLVLGLIYADPLVFQLKPTNGFLGPTVLPIWPRYTNLIMLSRPHLLTLLYFASTTRRHLPCLVLTSKPRSCDYQSLIMLISAYWPPSLSPRYQNSSCRGQREIIIVLCLLPRYQNSSCRGQREIVLVICLLPRYQNSSCRGQREIVLVLCLLPRYQNSSCRGQREIVLVICLLPRYQNSSCRGQREIVFPIRLLEGEDCSTIILVFRARCACVARSSVMVRTGLVKTTGNTLMRTKVMEPVSKSLVMLTNLTSVEENSLRIVSITGLLELGCIYNSPDQLSNFDKFVSLSLSFVCDIVLAIRVYPFKLIYLVTV